MSRKYTKEVLQQAVDNSLSVRGVLDHLGLRQAGGTHAYISRLIKKFEIDTSHFHGQGHMKGKVALNRKEPTDVLVVLPEGSNRIKRGTLLRAMLTSGVLYKCSECGILDEWNGKKLTLDIDHVDGDWLNNLLDNLRFLCPNCHSQCESSNKPHKYR